jgi:hypothetical protein
MKLSLWPPRVSVKAVTGFLFKAFTFEKDLAHYSPERRIRWQRNGTPLLSDGL